MSGLTERLARAEALLRAHGFPGARVRVAGTDGDIAAVALPAAALQKLVGERRNAVVEEVLALGFRYVAVDLAADA